MLSPLSNTRPNWHAHRGLIGILVLFLVLGGIYSVTTPILEASDELWHYPFVKHLADGRGLPVQNARQPGLWRQEGSQPPLYYVLGALLTRRIDTSDLMAVRQINPHANIGMSTRDGNVNMLVHTPRERFPYRGTVLAIHVIRWFSVLLGAVTVWAGYRLALTLCPDNRLLALGTACCTAFNAMYLFITSSVNNDALVIMLCALCLWLMVHYIASRPTPTQWAVLGVLLGLGSLTKASALGLLPLGALTILSVALRHKSWRDFVTGSLLVALPILFIGGWWYYRNWRLYHDPLGLSAFVAIQGARYPVPSLRQLLGEWRGFVMSYWGLFGGMNIPAPTRVYGLLSAFGLLGLAGVPLALWRAHREEGWNATRWQQWGLVMLWPIIVFVSLIRWTLMTPASQGRLMFAALTALSLLMAWGLAGWLPRRTKPPLRALLSAGMSLALLTTACALPFSTIRPAYAVPPILHAQDIAKLSTRLDVTFGEGIRLLGYRADQTQVIPGSDVALTLYWQCLAAMPANYSVFVHLLGDNDLIIGQRDMYPGQGNYATTLWSPGDVLADTYVVPVAQSALTPSEAEFEVGLYRQDSGIRLEARNAQGNKLGDAVRFGRVQLPLRTLGGVPNPLDLNLDDRVALAGYRLDRTAAVPGEALHLTLYWRALRDGDTNYSVFVHVLGEQERIWAAVDSWPQTGNAPTATWRKGQTIEDAYTLVLAKDAPPGIYDLELGMYAADGKRLNLLSKQGFAVDTRILLGKVRILPAQ